MSVFLAFTCAAAVTFVLRSSMTWSGLGAGSDGVRAWIALVTPAVLTAMVASALFLDHGQLERPDPAEVLAIVAAVVVVRRTRNVSTALLVGLPIYWLVAPLL